MKQERYDTSQSLYWIINYYCSFPAAGATYNMDAQTHHTSLARSRSFRSGSRQSVRGIVRLLRTPLL